MATGSITAEDTLMLRGISDELGFSDTRYNSLCNTYKDLSEDQRGLFLDLLRRFLYIPLSKYPEELAVATQALLDNVSEKNLLIYNGLSNHEIGNIKSNYLISYEFKGSNLRSNVNWRNRKLEVIHNIKGLLKKDNFEDTALILVDDFVGTGETIERAFYDIYKRLEVHGKVIRKFAVLSIVSMQKVVERLSKSGIMVYCSHVINRGISDYYNGTDLQNAIRLMNEIERKRKFSKSLRFGYKQSEALVCMERCPNNTFPLFNIGPHAIFRR